MKKLLFLILSLSIMCLAACKVGDTSENSSSDSKDNSSISSEVNSSEVSEDLGDASSDSVDDSSDLDGNDSVEKQSYTITFKQEGVEDIVKTVEEGESLTDIPVPNEILGYNVAWSVTDFSNVAENMTVEVVKTAKTYTITYTLGSCANDALAQIESNEQQVAYDAAYELATPTCEGYIFTGWLLEDTTTPFEDGVWNIDGNVTLVAQWTVDPASNRDHTGRF